MKLIRLTLQNFKGTRDLTIHANGADVSIFGDNGCGKTTVADAFFWLLFGKDSLGKSEGSFGIKTRDESGEPMHRVEHTVEAELLMEDGSPLVLKRTYKEVYTRDRNSPLEQHTSHTTVYRVNSVEVRESDYKARIAGICTEERFRLLTDPTFFPAVMKWQDRRRMLLDMCGDVTDAEVIASDPELADLPKYLGTFTLDQYRAETTKAQSLLNKQIDEIPNRIDEMSRSVASLAAVKGNPQLVAKLRKEIADLNGDRALVLNGGVASLKLAAISQAEAEMSRIETECRRKASEGVNSATAERAEYDRKAAAAARDALQCESRLNRLRSDLASNLARRERLIKDRDAITAAQFDGETKCRACGQELPPERVAEATQKFNDQQAEKKAAIIAEGKALQASREEIQAAIAQEEAARDAALLAEREATAKRDAVVIPKAEAFDLSAVPAYQAAFAEKARLQSEVEDMRLGSAKELTALDAQIAKKEEELRVANEAVARQAQREEAAARIESLKEEQKTHIEKFNANKMGLFLSEKFIRAKVSLLTDRINSRFERARFILFETQMNGGISECCELTINGKPYTRELSNSERINAGLDAINAFADQFGFAPPVFIDNAEAVTKLIPTRGQKVRLVVSADDTALRIETAERAAPAQQELYA